MVSPRWSSNQIKFWRSRTFLDPKSLLSFMSSSPFAFQIKAKSKSAYRKSWEQIQMWGPGGLWGGIFIVHIIKRIPNKLFIIMLLHFGLVDFMISFRKTLATLICLVSGLGGRVHDSTDQYDLSLGTLR